MDTSPAPTMTPVQHAGPALATPTSTPSAARARDRNPAIDIDDGSDTVLVTQQPASFEDAIARQPATAHGATADDIAAWRREMQELQAENAKLIKQLTQLRKDVADNGERNPHHLSQSLAPEDPSGEDDLGDLDGNDATHLDGGSQGPPDRTSHTPPNRESARQHIVVPQEWLDSVLDRLTRATPTIQVNKPPTFDGSDLSKFRSWWMSMESYLSIHDTSRMTDEQRIYWVGMSLTSKAHGWHYQRDRTMRAAGQKDTWDDYCKALRQRFTDPAQKQRDYSEMRDLKYKGDISAYLTRIQDLNLTAQCSGVALQNLILANIPDQIYDLMHAHHGEIPQEDDMFLEAVKRAGLSYERKLANRTLIKREPSAWTKEQSKSDRRGEQSSTSSTNSPAQTNRQRASATTNTKDQTWPSMKEALQGIAQADVDKRKKAKVSCWRCGRDNHRTLNCYAKRDLDGKDLPSPPSKAPKVAGVKRRTQDTAEAAEDTSDQEQPAPKTAKISAVTFCSDEPRIFEMSDSDLDGTESGFSPNRPGTPTGGARIAGITVAGLKRTAEDNDEQPNKKLRTPRIGRTRPIVPMTIMYNTGGRHREHPIRVLLDTGSDIPVLSDKLVELLGIPHYDHDSPVPLLAFTGDVIHQESSRFTGPVILRHGEDHFSRLEFEIGRLASDSDAILPFWWIDEHDPKRCDRSDPSKVTFTSPSCRRNCTRLRVLGKLGKVAGVAATDELADIPERFRDLVPLPSPDLSKRLPEHKPWDHAIDLIEGKTPPWGPIYALSEKELRFLRKWLDEMLAEGKIRPSKSSCGAPLFMVDKDASLEKKGRHEDHLRPVVDWRGLNAITVPNRFPLPLISELQDRLAGAKYFTKIDLKSGFNLVRIKKGDEWKTAFRCRYGLFEFTVMHFGLVNAPATFQAMINGVLSDLIDMGVLAYVDDVLIYAKTMEEHDRLVREVLRRLKANNLTISPKKCVWAATEVEYLGYIISENGISMSKEKVDCILNWQRPQSLKETQSFIGFANFYRRFIKGFSAIAQPLTSSMKLDAKSWKWTPEMDVAFQRLKEAFTTAPILVHFDPSKVPIVETDASDFALGAVLSQKGDDNKLHPVAFHSRKLTKPEMNYEVHDKELLAVVDSFSRWRRYLEGAEHRIEVFSDHQNLAYFKTAKVLNRRQARWAQELAAYDFIIHYRPGEQNGKADVLSRLEQYRPDKGGDEDQPITSVLREDHFADEDGSCLHISSVTLASIPVGPRWTDEFVAQVKEAARDDPAYLEALAHPGKDSSVMDGLLYYKGRLWVPDNRALKRSILESEHDSKVAGHWGMDRTADLIRRNFWWPGMERMVRQYVRGCRECQQNKSPRHGVFGLLQPLENHWKPWRAVSMDFITDLPLSNGCDTIWVMVDPFTKMAHFIPLKVDGKKTEDLISIFAREYWRLHGIPLDIISDRDSRFTSRVWKDFLKLVGIKSRMSTAFHPPTDGQTEIINQLLEMYLRAFVNYEMANWVDLLPMAEFAYNNARSSSTGMSPFYANYGYHPSAHNPPTGTSLNPASRLYAHWMTRVHEEARRNLEETRARMKRWADKRRTSPPEFQEGQLVMLNAKNIRTRRPSKKLDKKMLGPFKILKVISPTAVRLALPTTWRIHNTFHVSLIEPYRAGIQDTPDPDQVLREADPIESEDYQVEKIMDSRVVGEGVKYLVKWEGWPQRKHWTWEPWEHFHSEGSKEMVAQFHRAQPEKPRDPRVSLG